MRYFEIIGEAETFATRHAAFQRQQQRQAKLRDKLAAATAASYTAHRNAADRQAKAETRRRDLLRQMQQRQQPNPPA